VAPKHQRPSRRQGEEQSRHFGDQAVYFFYAGLDGPAAGPEGIGHVVLESKAI